MRPFAHFKTITKHRNLVCRYCFRVGLYWQGLTHDLSKYSPAEFWRGAKYYLGYRSPNDEERMETGVSMAWLHHKGRNKHHLEYWIDYSLEEGHQMTGMRMPTKYVVEMFCDRVAACKNYRGNAYTDGDAYDYYQRSKDHYLIHPQTAALLEFLLKMLRDNGEEKTLLYIKYRILRKK